MDNTFLIIIISLIAAVNILAIIIGIRTIAKIKIDKQKISEQITKEISTALLKIEQRDIKGKTVLNDGSKPDNEEKKQVIKEEQQNKFLKYTSNGYISPKDDSELKKYIWR